VKGALTPYTADLCLLDRCGAGFRLVRLALRRGELNRRMAFDVSPLGLAYLKALKRFPRLTGYLRRRLQVAAEAVLDAADLLLEGLARAVTALVELEDRVDALHALLEGDCMQLPDDGQDVLGRALERGAHRVHLETHPLLLPQPPLDLRDVPAGAELLAPER
jgi:hypothetical protein